MLQMCLNGKNTVIIWLLCFISSDLVYYLMFINYYTLKTTSLKVLFIFVDLHHFLSLFCIFSKRLSPLGYLSTKLAFLKLTSAWVEFLAILCDCTETINV